MDQIWDRIEEAFKERDCLDQLNEGATPEQVDQLQADLGLELPAELRDSLLRHNGSTDGGWPTGELLGTDRILQEANVWRELLADGTFADNADHDASEGAETIQQGWWNQGWIPLDADGGGNGAVIDAAPGPKGTVGQVLDMDHEVGPSGPTHNSLADYLSDIADRIDSEEFVWEDGYWEQA